MKREIILFIEIKKPTILSKPSIVRVRQIQKYALMIQCSFSYSNMGKYGTEKTYQGSFNEMSIHSESCSVAVNLNLRKKQILYHQVLISSFMLLFRHYLVKMLLDLVYLKTFLLRHNTFLFPEAFRQIFREQR